MIGSAMIISSKIMWITIMSNSNGSDFLAATDELEGKTRDEQDHLQSMERDAFLTYEKNWRMRVPEANRKTLDRFHSNAMAEEKRSGETRTQWHRVFTGMLRNFMIFGGSR